VLDTLAVHYADQVAAITYYTGGGDPFYSSEGNSRWRFYPPPYWYNGNWVYAWPWLWMDGDKDPGYNYNTWEAYLIGRMGDSSDLTIDMSGSYDPVARDGWVDVSIHNESPDTLSGTMQMVVTESGLYYEAPNGLNWHDHVMRDMVPSYAGTPVTIPPGDTAVLNQTFVIDAEWEPGNCEIVIFVQDVEMQPDSTIEVWQGSKLGAEFFVEEETVHRTSVPLRLSHSPNPARDRAVISFGLTEASEARIRIFDVTGREIRRFELGYLSEGDHGFALSRSDLGVPAGTYFYRLEAGNQIRTKRFTFLE
jgi:hypothetical protein